jgi:hypothetical protein
VGSAPRHLQGQQDPRSTPSPKDSSQVPCTQVKSANWMLESDLFDSLRGAKQLCQGWRRSLWPLPERRCGYPLALSPTTSARLLFIMAARQVRLRAHSLCQMAHGNAFLFASKCQNKLAEQRRTNGATRCGQVRGGGPTCPARVSARSTVRCDCALVCHSEAILVCVCVCVCVCVLVCMCELRHRKGRMPPSTEKRTAHAVRPCDDDGHLSAMRSSWWVSACAGAPFESPLVATHS